MLSVYATANGLLVEHHGRTVRLAPPISWDDIFSADDPLALVQTAMAHGEPAMRPAVVHAPLGSQEVWAAGVTYLRSRNARMEESQKSGGDTFYDRVYAAARPELFFKSTPHRVAAPGTPVRIRQDSKWDVPEPELTLAINRQGRIFGYTIGNDMSSRDIEGENPLYLPQAKVYDRSAALGPCLWLTNDPLPANTAIALEIRREQQAVFTGRVEINQIKRPLAELAEYLFREQSFPHGVYLMTGTGIVPPDTFTLQSGDTIHITIEPIGTLVNVVA